MPTLTLTLTIDLSESDYQDALALPESERVRLVTNAFVTARNEPRDDEPVTEEDIAAIRKGLADEAAGNVHDGEEFHRLLRSKIAASRINVK